MKNIAHYIETVKEQIEYFDYVLNKLPKSTATQAKFWPLKYKFEQLLEYLIAQQKSATTSSYPSFLTTKKLPESEHETKIAPSPRQKTLETENAIFEIVKKHPAGVDTKTITELLSKDYGIEIGSKLASRLWIMHSHRGLLRHIKKGFYAVKE